MVVFIDDEKWIIQSYIDELEIKSEIDSNFQPMHFRFPKEAMEFIQENINLIKVVVIDIGMDYGDGELITREPGGVQLYENIRNNKSTNNIPIIILTVFEKSDLDNRIPLDDNFLTTYINRNQPDRDESLWKNINNCIMNNHF